MDSTSLKRTQLGMNTIKAIIDRSFLRKALSLALWMAALTATLWSVGCDADLKEGVYACDLDGPRGCPPGWVCSLRPGDNQPRCYKTGTATCGNGVREMSEECDGSDFGVRTCLTERGLSEGQLRCTSECTLDVSGCFECGNGVIDGPEECDNQQLAGETCTSLAGRDSGEVACTAECTFDVSGCHTCGDGLIEGPEACDATNLGGASCADVGMDGGAVTCDASCLLDNTGCYTCGDGLCERGKGESRQSCAAECGWSDVSAGGYHTCALTGDGSVWCWGSNSLGQLGDAQATGGATPVAVRGLPEPASNIACGHEHGCALLDGGDVWCWGDNSSGQLGDGSYTGGATPVAVVGLTNANGIWAGDAYTCATDENDNALCWGLNDEGQLGDGSTSGSATPVAVVGPGALPSLSLGDLHACGIDAQQTLWCWGRNIDAQLGLGTNDATTQPLVASALGDATTFQVGAGGAHTCAVVDAGDVLCWGRNVDGQLGNGDSTTYDATPQTVTGLSAAINVEAGSAFTCALLTAGEVWCWGTNLRGQLGNRDHGVNSSSTPVYVAGLDDAQSISLGSDHACGLLGDFTLWCWGRNASGQLGESSTTSYSATPLMVVEP